MGNNLSSPPLDHQQRPLPVTPKTEDIVGRMSDKASEMLPPAALKTDNISGGKSEKASEKSLPAVALDIGDISAETRLANQRKMLQQVTTPGADLDSVYGQTLQQIKDQKGDRPRLGVETLMWASHAKRPLRINELCHALAVDVEARDLDPKKIQSQDTVLGSCLGLTMVDKKTSIVRPIDDTLQEYLSRPGILPGAHKTLGETCLAYLNFDQVKKLPANKVEGLEHLPFLEYSSLYWAAHARIELSDRSKTLALELLNQNRNHISFKKMWPSYYHEPSYPLTSLHCASELGIDGVVAALIEAKSCNINQEDSRRYTPLMCAVQGGNHGAVKLLLACNGVDIDKSEKYSGRTPLWHAAAYGDVEMVKLLAQAGADPNTADRNGNTPLMMASHSWDQGKFALLRPRAITMSDLV